MASFFAGVFRALRLDAANMQYTDVDCTVFRK